MYKRDCIVVNLLGGPGVGKSILTSELFVEFKKNFISTEISPEYIKKKLREKSQKAIQSQIYIFGKQQYQLFTLKDEVDVVITDSPFIFSSIYDDTNCPELRNLILKEYNKYNNMNYLILRDEDVGYENEGRFQDLEGAKKVDKRIKKFLEDNDIEHKEVMGIDDDTVETILCDVLRELKK